jgi:ATP-binding cassette subfamily A (ABC1) protein 3
LASTSQSNFDVNILGTQSASSLQFNWFNIWAESIKTNVAGNGLYQYSYTVWTNTTFPHSGHIGLALMNNQILKLATGNANAYIKHVIKPMPLTPQFEALEDTADSIVLTFLVGVAFAFLPAGIVVFLVMERENNVKHQQLISGVSLLAYWTSNLVVDMGKYLIIATWCAVMMQAFGVKAFTRSDHYGAV